MPVVPVCLMEPLWDQFSALLPERPLVSPTHPLGCHRQRIPDRIVFEHVIAALVHGSGYERIASPGCSDATIRRRLIGRLSRAATARVPRITVDQGRSPW